MQSTTKLNLATSTLVLVLLLSCGRQKVNIDSEKAAILKCWNDWSARTSAGDPAYYWTEDVVLMGPGVPTVKGKEAFRKMYAEMSNRPGFKMTWAAEPPDIEVSTGGGMAYLFSRNEMEMTDSGGSPLRISNQVIQIWKKDKEGNWRAAVSIMYPDPLHK
jgi:ketosteroid isomerase-like protein